MTQTHSFWRLMGLTLALLAAGCAPAPRREATEVKKANEAAAPAPTAEVKPPVAPATSPVQAPPPAQANANPPANPPAVAAVDNPTAPAPAAQPPVAPAAAAVQGGVFKGRVKIKGTFAALPPKVVPANAGVCAVQPVPDQSVLASPDGGLANVFVYMISKPAGDVPPVPEQVAVLDQINCVYTPHVQIVRLNQPIRFKNSDDTPHNVQVKGFANEANPTLGPKSQSEDDKLFRFTKPERLPVSISCSFHGFMQAWMLVVETPWAGVTDAQGNFQVAGLPDGEHTFNVWQEKAGLVARNVKITITGGQPVSQDFEVDASKLTQ